MDNASCGGAESDGGEGRAVLMAGFILRNAGDRHRRAAAAHAPVGVVQITCMRQIMMARDSATTPMITVLQ